MLMTDSMNNPQAERGMEGERERNVDMNHREVQFEFNHFFPSAHCLQVHRKRKIPFLASRFAKSFF